MNIILNYHQLNEIFLNKDKYQDWFYILDKAEVKMHLYLADLELDDSIKSRISDFSLSFNNGSNITIFNNIIDIDIEPNYVILDKRISVINRGNLLVDDAVLQNPFKLNYFKNLIKGKTSNNWKVLFNERNLVSNSLIINDPYILHINDNKRNRNNDKANNQRDINILYLIDSILPKDLDVPYHILIVTDKNKDLKDFQINTFYKYIPDLINKIESLRSYEIKVEVVIDKAFHKRKLFTNFLNVTTDKGFKIFDDQEDEVLDNNDLLIETMYTRNNTDSSGDTQYDEMKIRILELKEYLKKSLKLSNLNSLSIHDKTYYFSNFEQTEIIEIKNRLYKSIE